MNNNTNKLTIKTIVTSLMAIAALATPAIAETNKSSILVAHDVPLHNQSLSNKPLKDKFFCELGENNFYRTVAYTKQGRVIELIIWKGLTNIRSRYTPKERCRIIAYRFQRFSDAGQLRYVSTGRMNRQPVICISSSGGACKYNGLLLTLDPKDNPTETLKELFDVGSRVDRGTLVRGGKTIDIRQLLHGTPENP